MTYLYILGVCAGVAWGIVVVRTLYHTLDWSSLFDVFSWWCVATVGVAPSAWLIYVCLKCLIK